MQRTLFCSTIFPWLITLIYSKHYLVEVENPAARKIKPDNAVTSPDGGHDDDESREENVGDIIEKKDQINGLNITADSSEIGQRKFW